MLTSIAWILLLGLGAEILLFVLVGMAVVSILLTAPFGAICVDTSYKKLLSWDEKN